MKRCICLLLLAIFLLFPACTKEAVETCDIIAADTKHPLCVRTFTGAAEGPTVYIVGGIHGDETAGWRAAEALDLTRLTAGTVCVLSPANPYGAENNTRFMADGRDLNRNFPGGSDEWDTSKTAAAIYRDIAKRQPLLVLDLHEAEAAEGRDDVRDSIIVYDVLRTSDLVWRLLNLSETDGLRGIPLTLFGSPAAGSLNRAVAEGLGIPVITVETNRQESLEKRIDKQKRIVEFVLAFYDMQKN